MESKHIKVKINRSDNEIKMEFIDFEAEDIVLSSDESRDLKSFFDTLFDYIIESRELVQFNLDDEGQQDLFHDVSVDIIQQLNSEIHQSEKNFSEIFELSD